MKQKKESVFKNKSGSKMSRQKLKKRRRPRLWNQRIFLIMKNK